MPVLFAPAAEVSWRTELPLGVAARRAMLEKLCRIAVTEQEPEVVLLGQARDQELRSGGFVEAGRAVRAP